MSRETCVKWLGLSAVYAEPEREILAALPVREQVYIHALKALTDGTVGSGRETVDQQVTSGAEESLGQTRPLTVYTDPEDIPFGEPAPRSRKRPVYALVWSWRKHKVYKTKRECQAKMKVWKRWYERQGWKVSSHAEGYFAAGPERERHAILIHEYDAATHERLV